MVLEISNMFDFFTDSPQQAWKLQPTLTDLVNIGSDSQKQHGHQLVSSSGTPPLGIKPTQATAYDYMPNVGIQEVYYIREIRNVQ